MSKPIGMHADGSNCYTRGCSLDEAPTNSSMHRVSLLSHPEKYLAAEEGHTSPAMLDQLAKEDDTDIRMRVASNPRTPSETLARFVADDIEMYDVLEGVALNPSTSPATLTSLFNKHVGVNAQAYEQDIREALIRNPKLPSEVLNELARCSDPSLRYEVITHENTTSAILVFLSSDDDSTIRESVAMHTSDSNTLVELSRDSDPDVRSAVFENPNTPAETLTELELLMTFPIDYQNRIVG